mmetsp:Transcript_6527/g.19811  ORF Transcript_6527/g.19811 Transcript_6527/m.19811 type:complete len:164 (+) Transcript_6527:60-551(+)
MVRQQDGKAAPEVGREAPYFAAKAQHGRVIRIQNYVGKVNLVLFFMPDLGEKSVKQAKEFNDAVGYFHQGQTAILGVCPQKPDKLQQFVKQHKLMYNILSDEAMLVFSAYASFRRFGKPTRSVFVLSVDGKVTCANRKKYSEKHVTDAKNAVKSTSESLVLAK